MGNGQRKATEISGRSLSTRKDESCESQHWKSRISVNVQSDCVSEESAESKSLWEVNDGPKLLA